MSLSVFDRRTSAACELVSHLKSQGVHAIVGHRNTPAGRRTLVARIFRGDPLDVPVAWGRYAVEIRDERPRGGGA